MAVLSKESYALMRQCLNLPAALAAVELLSNEAELRYGSFYPVGDMIVGLRYHKPGKGSGRKAFGRTLKIADGRIVPTPYADVNITPPRVPHHVEHGFGYWHINDEQEMSIRLQLEDGRRATMLLEGFPQTGRKDRFAWYCMQCLTPLYMGEIETGRVGLPGFWLAEEKATLEFNADLQLRTCRECGWQHPLGYSWFEAHDTPEQATARLKW